MDKGNPMSDKAFDPVPQNFSFPDAEKETIRFWKERGIYGKSLDQRRGAEPFLFFEGPPTANGMPHPGHCLTRTIKDIFPRYKTMDGYYCERKAGWDTHGLPVEVEVCKELGIIDGGKAAIEAYGVDKFNRACIDSVFRYKREWEELTDRIGFWVNLEDAYVTFHQSYVESVWWCLKRLFERGLLYQGHKVVWWWAQGGTALSAGEVGEGYRDTDDPAVTVRFAVTEADKERFGLAGQDLSLLIWTTTPWTLSSNCAIAAGADVEYAVVKTPKGDGHEFLILAKAVVERYFKEGEYEIADTFLGDALLGVSYEPVFRYDTPTAVDGGPAEKFWQVILGDFVDIETGSGLVHIAPAFGEDDYRVCKESGIGFLCFVKPDGTFDERVADADPYEGKPIAGQFCKAADKAIVRLLKERGALLKQDTYRHSYPFCPRADQDPLIQYARKSWFIRTSDFVPQFLANNAEIAWQPEHIKNGRFGNFLENNVDWALSRERFWGTPLPVWVCEKTGHMEAVGSYAELLAKPGVQGVEVWEQAKAADPALDDNLRVHKPYIDAVTYQSPKDPASRMRRVTEVIDVWFDAGSMPFAQWGYPHVEGSAEKLAQNFPADFISEAIDQTRGWFNALLVISTVLWDGEKKAYPHPFKNCICLGHIMGEDGLKLSKRLKNYSEPRILFDKFSADALRWSFIAKNPPTSTGRLAEKNVEEAQREMLIRWLNVYSFFVIYANLDGFDPASAPADFLRDAAGLSDAKGGSDANYRPREQRAELDRWILGELDRTIARVRAEMDAFECYPAANDIAAFLDGLSNWYVRRSRQRFWASGWSEDKADAYWTLYECLLKFARLAAPFLPFFSDVTWRNLAKPLPGAPESVHLASYPAASSFDGELLDAMNLTREAVNLGLRARRVSDIKVRQPLGKCEIVAAHAHQVASLTAHLDLLKDELNIKEIEFTGTPEDYVTYEVKPNFKVLGPRFGKQMKSVAAVLAQSDGADLYNQLTGTGAIHVEVDGQPVELGPDEVEVRLAAKEGFAAAQGAGLVVILSTEITPELREEGWVREFIRYVQDQRKDRELAYDARIALAVQSADGDLLAALQRYESLIAGEVLAASIAWTAPESAPQLAIDGKPLRVAVETV